MLGAFCQESVTPRETKLKKHMHTTAVKVVFGSKLLVGNFHALSKIVLMSESFRFMSSGK